MLDLIALIIIVCLCMVNMFVLFSNYNTPQHNAMDKYNDKVIGYDWGLVNRIEERLAKLEADFKYHIQSTDELKPKA